MKYISSSEALTMVNDSVTTTFKSVETDYVILAIIFMTIAVFITCLGILYANDMSETKLLSSFYLIVLLVAGALTLVTIGANEDRKLPKPLADNLEDALVIETVTEEFDMSYPIDINVIKYVQEHGLKMSMSLGDSVAEVTIPTNMELRESGDLKINVRYKVVTGIKDDNLPLTLNDFKDLRIDCEAVEISLSNRTA